MEDGFDYSGAGLPVINESLIVSLNEEPDDESIRWLQKKILLKMESSSIRAVLVDVSNVRVLDSILFAVLAETAKMVKLLGGRTIFVGFRAGVASALVDLDVDLASIETAVTMEDGLEQLGLSLNSPRTGESDGEGSRAGGTAPDDSEE